MANRQARPAFPVRRRAPPFELAAKAAAPLAPPPLTRLMGPLALGPMHSELVTRQSRQSAISLVSPLADEPECRLTLRQVDQARADFTAIESDLQFIMSQLACIPTRREQARNTFGIIFATAMLTTLAALWFIGYWRYCL